MILSIIVVAFVWLTDRLNAERRLRGDVLELANDRLIQFQISFSDEVAAGRSYLLHPADSGLSRIRTNSERPRRILDDLSRNASPLGPGFVSDLAALREMFGAWGALPDAMIQGRVSANAFVASLPKQEGLADSVVAKAARLGNTVSVQMRRQLQRTEALEYRRLLVLAALFPVAVIGTVLTAWFAAGAVRSHRRVLRNVAFEALLRDSIAMLTGEQIHPQALSRIALNAARCARADAAFIERSDEARTEVEVVAGVGTGAPAVGTRIPFDGSMTDAIVRAGTPELIVDLGTAQGRLRGIPWDEGTGIGIPLHGDGGDVDGALVLQRHSDRRPGPETIARLHSLGAWVAVALRRKRLAAQLDLERSRLEAVVSEMPVGVALAEAPSGRIVSFNRKGIELWGSAPSLPSELEEYDAWPVLHPGGQPYRLEERPITRSIRQGEVVRGEEAEIEGADGKRSVVRINTSPIRDAHGVISSVVIVVVDISEERKREERARFLDDISRQLASTLDYDATIQAALQLVVPRYADAASVHHREGDILLRRWDTSGTDAQFERLFRALERDYPLQLPSAHPVAVAVRTGKAQLHEVVDDQLLRTIGRNEQEVEGLRSLGIRSAMTLPLTVRGKTIGAMQLVSRNPKRRYTSADLALGEEITRRVAMAIDNAQLFRAVDDGARVSEFMSDVALTISGSLESDEVLRRVTRAAVPFLADFTLAYSLDEQGVASHVVSAHADPSKANALAEAANLHHPNPKEAGNVVVRAMSAAQPILVERVTPEFLDAQGFEPRARQLYSDLNPISLMAIPLVARDKALGALVFVSTNPDDPYGTADLVIGQALASRTALAMESAMLLEKERDALNTRDEVLAIVSHDLRDPLNTIGMSAQMLMEVPVEDTDRQKHLRVISRAKDRMNRLIQDLVDVARMKAGKSLSVEIRPEQFGSVIHEACEAFAESTREKGVELECQLPDDVPDVMIDRRRILQVFSNLLGNALKFTPEGGRIQLRAEGIAENKVQVSVRDSGPGIPPENLKQIFEAFWQAPRTARLGAGLGLAISRGIVQLHDGRIWAESREGEGSTFFFTIPTAHPKEHQAAAS